MTAQTVWITSLGSPCPVDVWPWCTIVQLCDGSPILKSSINCQSALDVSAAEAALDTTCFGPPNSANTIPWHKESLVKNVRNCASKSRTSAIGSPTHGLLLFALAAQPLLTKSTFHQSSTTRMGALFVQPADNAKMPQSKMATALETHIKLYSTRFLDSADSSPFRTLPQPPFTHGAKLS